MQYLLLIYSNETQWNQLNEADKIKIFGEYRTFTNSITDSGHYKGGNRLDFTPKAKTVRIREGKKSITDGPFAETKEQLAGYYILDCKDLDEAIYWGSKIPTLCGGRKGSLEIRPIQEVTSCAISELVEKELAIGRRG